MQRTFIISTGRTGTLYFARALAQANPGVGMSHESSGSRALNFLGNMALAGLPTKPALHMAWKSTFGQPSGQILESNNMIWAALSLAGEMRETDCIVHIVRDPRTYVTSHMGLVKSRWKSCIANFLPFWQPGYRILLDQQPKKIFRRFCKIWRCKNEFIRRAYARGRYQCLRYEDLFAAQPEFRLTAWQEFEHFCGLAVPSDPGDSSDRINAAPGGRHWHSWSAQECRLLDASCGDLAREYGYCAEPEWLAKLEIKA